VEELARREAEAAARNREVEIIADAQRALDDQIVTARKRLAVYEAALEAGAPKRRIWTLDDVVGGSHSSRRLEQLRNRRKFHSQTADALGRQHPFACWFQRTVGLSLNKSAEEFQEATKKTARYIKAGRKLRQQRKALQAQLEPIITRRQALADAEYRKADALFTEAVNNLDHDLRKLAERQTTQEMQAMGPAAVAISTKLPAVAMPPPKPRPTSTALRPRPRW
jgi:hypothetical protein